MLQVSLDNEKLVCQLDKAQEVVAALQSEVAQAVRELRRIELEADQEVERRQSRQREIQTLLDRMALASDTNEKVSSKEDITDVINEVEEWLSVQPDTNDEIWVSSKFLI
jgi:hypothetical protein